MRIVALGGTGFLSSAVVEAAREVGHDVVVVSRGQHGAPPREDVTWVRADRADSDALAAALAGIEADAVIDSCGYSVGGARAAASALAGVPRYAYVSSISAYRDWPPGPIQDEDAPLFTPEDNLEDCGPMKAASERVLGGAVHAHGLAGRDGPRARRGPRAPPPRREPRGHVGLDARDGPRGGPERGRPRAHEARPGLTGVPGAARGTRR